MTTQQPRKISLGNDFGPIVVEANGVQVVIEADGRFHAANDTSARATPEIGAIESTGEHQGEIYGGIYPADNKPIWFLAAPKAMSHFKAAAWAKKQGGSLPTGEHGDYLTTLKGEGGAFAEIFNRDDSFPAGFVWLAKPLTGFITDYAWCQKLSNGDQYTNDRGDDELPVLSVRR